ncbi:MAG TPA: recombinase A [Pyrodictium delaneyi]|uniref:Recombinase A n=1 Tax=Pyrodictium delaneyi TaxID=1273541 RepID=A0A832ZV64_9CREN|nr:recombinase A [Pyrodictium delaneyi]
MTMEYDDKLVPLGIEGLDDILDGGVRRGSIILVAGSPGSGKTSFAARFVYEGLTRGEPGIYLSFNEYREEFLENMSRLGLDFEVYEEQGKFVFIEALNINDEEAISATLESLLSAIDAIGAKRLVIDTITSILRVLGSDQRARELLHSLFIHHVKRHGVTTILTAELPVGSSRLGYGIEEFVVDGLIMLKTSFSGDKIIRTMEILKMRGHRTTLARLTYAIVPGKVIAVRTPPKILNIPAPSEVLRFRLSAANMSYSVSLPRGSQILVSIHPAFDPPTILLGLACNIEAEPPVKVLYRSFTRSPDEVKWILRRLSCSDPTVEITKISSINPTIYSATELAMHSIDEDLRVMPDVVVVDGIKQAFWLSGEVDVGIREHFNNIQHRRIHGITGVYVYSAALKELVNTYPLYNIYDTIFYIAPRRMGNALYIDITTLKLHYSVPSQHVTLPVSSIVGALYSNNTTEN